MAQAVYQCTGCKKSGPAPPSCGCGARVTVLASAACRGHGGLR